MDSWKLGILQAVALQKLRLLVLAEQNVCWDQLVVCDVDEQILLEEALNSGLRGDSWDNLHGRWSNVDVRDEDTGVEVSTGEGLGKCAHLFDADVGVSQKLDINGANVWLWWVWVLVGSWVGVFLDHFLGWAGCLDHLLATGEQLVLDYVELSLMRISICLLRRSTGGVSVLELVEGDALLLLRDLVALLPVSFWSRRAYAAEAHTLSANISQTVLHARQSLAVSRSATSRAFC